MLFCVTGLYAQSNKELAKQKGQEAVELMDNGQITESITLLKEAMQLDPESNVYPYEIALAHYYLKEYKKAIDILEKLAKRKDVSKNTFQLLGNSYDMEGNPSKAIATYEKGLKKFPNAGNLYLEMGVMQIAKEDYDKALSFFEKGIEADPAYPSNYYWTSKIFIGSSEKLWGMIYGELFMNLERNSKRTQEISKLLFDTYKSQIQFTSDTSISVSFSKISTISLSELADPKNLRLPYGLIVYEPTLLLSIPLEKKIDISALDRIRTRFVQTYFKNDHHKKYPNVLFSFQKQLLEIGHLEAYNHWILMQGDEQGFTEWEQANKDKWNSFVEWFTKNPLQIEDSNKFIRATY